MPIIDCAKLLEAKKQMVEPKRLAEAFVNHVLPKVAALDLEKEFLEHINNGLPAEVPIFSYKASGILADDDHTLPCGTPIRKAVSGSSALELLGMAIGSNIRVFKEESAVDTIPLFLVKKVTLVARLENNPPARSASVLSQWPHADKLTVKDGKVVWPQDVQVEAESAAAEAYETYDSDYEQHQDEKCSFCGLMTSKCGEDHGDEMRDIGLLNSSGQRGWLY